MVRQTIAKEESNMGGSCYIRIRELFIVSALLICIRMISLSLQ